MDEIIIKGITEVEGMKFHDIEGGFGPDKKAMLAKDIAEIHGRELKVINQAINMNRKRFKDGIHIVDLRRTEFEVNLIDHGIYSQNGINRSEAIYLLSERGYAILLKILEDDVAWEQYDKLVDGYFKMRKETKANFETLSPQLQALIAIEIKQKEHEARLDKAELVITENQTKIDGIKEMVALNPTAWRSDCARIVVKIAQKLGGNEHIRDVYEEIYSLLDQRFGILLGRRLTNLKKDLTMNGLCKSKVDKKNKLDVIANDKKLIEAYIIVVKDMAIKYGAIA